MLSIEKENKPFNQHALFDNHGEIGKILNVVDWSKNALGPAENWPESLKSAISICLGSLFPAVVLSGPEYILFYNEAHIPITGNNHPSALGVPGAIVWPESWHIVEPMLASVRKTGKSIRSDDLLFLTNQSGFLEENYFTFSYSPIGMHEGGINSVFAWVLMTTENVLSKRRSETLRNLSGCLTKLNSMDVLCPLIMTELAKNNADVPFSLLYLIDNKREKASLAGTTGLKNHAPLAPPIYPLHTSDEKLTEHVLWPMAEVVSTGKFKIVDVMHLSDLPKGHWDKPPLQVILVPIIAPGQDFPTGILVAAVSPMRQLDESYITFYQTAATHIAFAIANTRAYEQEHQRAEALAEIDLGAATS